AGVLLAAGGAVITEGLARRRQRALELAERNEELFAEQRDVAVALQRSLLPQLPDLDHGLEVAAHYEPATAHTEVGGDWYDVVSRDDGSVVLIVGDVAGHGIDAAAAMAELRFAARAYAA